ncbi:MAG: DNA starvation/stationary phase protection protein [Flavobacteriaceae bacterium]|nr:DNA starvation/stationary phase protection protein [Flavobacteriaceae bacterium]
MAKLNQIGLAINKSKELSNSLNDLLANYSVFYQNVRGFHWKIKGNNFFELHLKFEELYNDLFIKIDDVAERILTLGQEPAHNFSVYLTNSEINEFNNMSDGIIGVAEILKTFKLLLKKQRQILKLSSEIGDEGTSSLMSDYIREQEKLVWMYSSFLNE